MEELRFLIRTLAVIIGWLIVFPQPAWSNAPEGRCVKEPPQGVSQYDTVRQCYIINPADEWRYSGKVRDLGELEKFWQIVRESETTAEARTRLMAHFRDGNRDEPLQFYGYDRLLRANIKIVIYRIRFRERAEAMGGGFVEAEWAIESPFNLMTRPAWRREYTKGLAP